jgi:hypothetical protein
MYILSMDYLSFLCMYILSMDNLSFLCTFCQWTMSLLHYNNRQFVSTTFCQSTFWISAIACNSMSMVGLHFLADQVQLQERKHLHGHVDWRLQVVLHLRRLQDRPQVNPEAEIDFSHVLHLGRKFHTREGSFIPRRNYHTWVGSFIFG